MIHINKYNLIQMLEISSAAYKDIQSQCSSSSKVTLIESEDTDVECFVRSKNNRILIVFRGTDSKLNWANNFCFAKKTVPYGNNVSKIRVHEGFLKNYKSVRTQIQKLIPQSTCRISITGHSLGAALAVLCAVDIQFNYPQADIEVYLFGCPRVGNKAFAKSYNRRVFKTLRVSNGNDIVTKVPPAIFGFRHVGINLHTGMLSLPFAISFKEHIPHNYYKSLWQSI